MPFSSPRANTELYLEGKILLLLCFIFLYSVFQSSFFLNLCPLVFSYFKKKCIHDYHNFTVFLLVFTAHFAVASLEAFILILNLYFIFPQPKDSQLVGVG